MDEHAVTSAPTDGGDHEVPRAESPAVRLLEAMRAGDDAAVVAAIGQSTTVVADNLPWACRGPDEVSTMLRQVRDRFPGLALEPSTRRVSFGVVVEEARVRDLAAETEAALASEVDEATRAAEQEARAETHPMWDAPRGGASDLLLWHEMGHSGLRLPPIPLNLPVRVTVRHDDLQVHEVRLSFPAALLRRALGEYVDPFEMSLSEVQSAFIAPAGAELTTHELTTHELTVPDPSPGSSPTPPAPTTAEPPRRRRRRRRFLALAVALLAVAAGATWWVAQDRSEAPVAAPSATPPSATPTAVLGAAEPSAPTSTAASSSQPPPVTRSRSTAAPHRTPSVTLESDLAFDSGSATLSSAAKAAVARAGRQAREAGLSGTIYVDGYTDDVGSAAYGAWLSQRRADAVATYLQSQLLGAPVSIVSQGHGESDPVASNTTAAGRQQNRRVTITLPHP